MRRPPRFVLNLVGVAGVALVAVASAHALEPTIPAGSDGAPSAPMAVNVESVSPDGVTVAGWGAAAVRTPSDPSAWGGERASFGGDGQPLSQRVASYDLKAKLDPDRHTVDGTEHLRWLNRSDRPIKSLYFHLYLNAFEGHGSTFVREEEREGGFRSDVKTHKGEWGFIDLKSVVQGGKAATFAYVHPDGGPETDKTVVRVDLPEAIGPGVTGELDLEFHDQLPRVVARTGYFKQYHLIAQWFPKVGVLELPGERGVTGGPRWNCHEFHLFSEFYADFGNYRAELTAPKGYLVRATGVEQGAPLEEGGALVHTFAQDDVHDFVWTAWNGYAEPLKGSYDGPGSPHVDVEVLYAPENEPSAQVALKGTIDSLRYFSETLGPYPYPHVTCVVPPYNAQESGGMEYETFFTTIGSNGLAAFYVRFVTVHEFGHGYFMGLLATNEFEEPFLDEGMNEFWDSRELANDRLEPHLPAAVELEGISIPPIAYQDEERLGGGTQRYPADPIAGNSWDRYSGGSYGLVYAHTVIVFHDLEKRLGEDAFARGMKLYYKRWHHRHPTTADLRDAIAEGSGQPALVNEWFETQVYRDTTIDDRVVKVASAEVLPQPGLFMVDGKRVEKDTDDIEKEISATREAWSKAHPDAKETDPGPFPYRNEVTVRRYAGHVPEHVLVTFADGTTETLPFPTEDRWHRYVFVKPVKVTSAQLDPERAIFLDLNKLDDGMTREEHHAASTRWALEAANAAELGLSLLVTQ
ncbi:MAG: M1 family metallopeptidase [Polyangiaceae bacterium]